MRAFSLPPALRSAGFLGGVLGTAFAVTLGFGLVAPVLPQFARDLGGSYTATSAVISVFAAVRLLASQPAGVAVDRLGPRPNVAVGLVIVALSSAVIPLGGSAVELIALRGFGGLGSALFIVGINQYVVTTIPRAQRGRAVGVLQGAFLLGGAAGPAVGGLVTGALGIAAPFYIYAGTLLVATVMTLRYMRRQGEADDENPATPPRSSDATAPGRPTGSDAPSTRDLLGDRTYVGVLVVTLAVTFASQGLRYVGIPLFGDEVIKTSEVVIGVALTVAMVGQFLLLLPASHVADSRGRLPPIRAGSLLLVLVLTGFTFVASAPGLLMASALLGGAYGVASPVPAAMAGDLAPVGGEGKAMGVLNIARDLGAITGPLAVGFLAERGGFDAAFLVCAGVVGVAFLASLMMRETLGVAQEAG